MEDPGFGHWIYKFAKINKVKVTIVTPINWGGNVKNFSDDYIVYHSQRNRLHQLDIFIQQVDRGHM